MCLSWILDCKAVSIQVKVRTDAILSCYSPVDSRYEIDVIIKPLAWKALLSFYFLPFCLYSYFDRKVEARGGKIYKNIQYVKVSLWKIIYCGETYEDIIDHRIYAHNLSGCEIKAWKKENNIQAWCVNGIHTHDLCDTDYTGTVSCQLSYQAIWELVSLWVRTLPVGPVDDKEYFGPRSWVHPIQAWIFFRQ